MKVLKPGQKVKYVGGLFPELEEELYTVVQVYPGSFCGVPYEDRDVEVIGDDTWNIFKKARIDFEEVEETE